MLTLSRKAGESIVLPDLGITICIYKINGNTVQVSIDAPKEIKIYRKEIAERIAASAILSEQ